MIVALRLPSLGHVVSAAQRGARRFPLVLVAGLVAGTAGTLLLHEQVDEADGVRLLMSATLGLPLAFGFTMLAERQARTPAAHWAVVGAAVLIPLAFWLGWPAWTDDQRFMRYAQLFIGAHLFVAVAPFVRRDEPMAFWQYNRILLLRFLLAGLYAAVLFVGVAGAVLAIDQLFGMSIEHQAYGRIWLLFAFVFNQWFFISGAPEDVAALEREMQYPRGLRVFVQYALVPIVVTYLVILTVYLVKVLVTWDWPSGWIGYLVSAVAGVGILSWLLLHPMEQRAEHGWVRTFTRWFYIALMPAIVMLWLAIWQRVAQYGITERRYFLVVLSIWLAGIALYYTFSRSRNIKVIPATLCAIAILSLAGPWGAYAVSRASQTGRIEEVLARNGMLAGDTVRPAPRELSQEDARTISSGVRYLLATHGRDAVNPWIPDSIRARLARGGRDATGVAAQSRLVLAALNVPEVTSRSGRRRDTFRHGVRRPSPAVNVAGYTWAVDLSLSVRNDVVAIADDLAVRIGDDSASILVTRAGAPVLAIPLSTLLDSLSRFGDTWQVPERHMRMEWRSDSGAALLRLTSIGGVNRHPRRVTNVAGNLYVRVR